MKIKGRPLPENPISALNEMADGGLIPRPVYEGESSWGESHMVVEVKGFGYVVGTGANKQEAKREAAAGILELVLKTVCPTPGKRRFATWESAYDDMIRQQSEGIGIQQVYACRCDWWHLSGATPRNWDTPMREGH